MSLRPYQAQAIEAVAESHAAGVAGQVISIPTSAGKTHIAASLPHKTKHLFLVGAEELVYQAQAKIQNVNPDLMVGIEKAERYADLDRHDVVVASVPSIAKKKRLERFARNSFDMIGVDECHHVSRTGGYADILRHFRALKSESDFDPSILLYGLSATPNRSDGVGLEHTFSAITFQRSLLDLMRDGITIKGKLYPYISDIVCHRIDTYADISSVKLKGRDFDDKALVEQIDTPERNALALDSYLKLGQGLGAFGYTCNIAHGVNLAKVFNDGGVPAVVMHGGTSREDRLVMFAALEEGTLKVIFSTGVLGEGVDQPKTCVGLMLRPTKSRLLFAQQAGRILRPYPAPEEMLRRYVSRETRGWRKEYAILLDFVDQSGHHSLIQTPTLFGLRNDFDMDGQSALEVANEVERLEKTIAVDVRQEKSTYEIKSLIEQVDLLKAPVTPPQIREWSKFQWFETAKDKYSLALHGNRSIRVALVNDYWEIATYTNGLKLVRWTEPKLRAAIRAGEGYIPDNQVRSLMEDAAHNDRPPTEQQCAYLWGLDKANLSRAHSGSHEFWLFSKQEYYSGNINYSSGGISMLINSRKVARPLWVQKRIAEHAKKKRSQYAATG